LHIIWKILDYLFLLRPTLFFPLWTILLAGRYNAAKTAGFASGSHPSLTLILVLFAALMGASYTINQLVDYEGDKTNRKLFLVADKYVKRDYAIWLSAVLTVLGLAGLFSLGFSLGLFGLVFILVTGIFYNLEPFRWKDSPILGPSVSVFGGAAAFFLGCLPSLNIELIIKCIPYLAAFTAVSILTSVPDMEGDRAAGKNTFALNYGIGLATAVAALMCLAAALIGGLTRDNIILWPALFSCPVFFVALYNRKRETVILAIKLSIFTLSLVVSFVYPGYLLLMALYFFFGRWYYRSRFDMEYPSFKLD